MKYEILVLGPQLSGFVFVPFAGLFKKPWIVRTRFRLVIFMLMTFISLDTLFPLSLFQGHVELVVGNYFTLTPGAPEEKACMAERVAPQTRHAFLTLIVPQHKVNGYLLYKEGS